jgi:hypothetical protein
VAAFPFAATAVIFGRVGAIVAAFSFPAPLVFLRVAIGVRAAVFCFLRAGHLLSSALPLSRTAAEVRFCNARKKCGSKMAANTQSIETIVTHAKHTFSFAAAAVAESFLLTVDFKLGGATIVAAFPSAAAAVVFWRAGAIVTAFSFPAPLVFLRVAMGASECCRDRREQSGKLSTSQKSIE